MPASNEEFIKAAFGAGLSEDQVKAAVSERNAKAATPAAPAKDASPVDEETGLTEKQLRHVQKALPHLANADSLIQEENAKYGTDPSFTKAILTQESGARQHADNGKTITSPTGAKGIGQFIRDTANAMGVNREDSTSNLKGSVRLIAELSQKYNGDPAKIAAGYNRGPTATDAAISKAEKDPQGRPFTDFLDSEGQGYVDVVTKYHDLYNGGQKVANIQGTGTGNAPVQDPSKRYSLPTDINIASPEGIKAMSRINKANALYNNPEAQQAAVDRGIRRDVGSMGTTDQLLGGVGAFGAENVALPAAKLSAKMGLPGAEARKQNLQENLDVYNKNRTVTMAIGQAIPDVAASTAGGAFATGKLAALAGTKLINNPLAKSLVAKGMTRLAEGAAQGAGSAAVHAGEAALQGQSPSASNSGAEMVYSGLASLGLGSMGDALKALGTKGLARSLGTTASDAAAVADAGVINPPFPFFSKNKLPQIEGRLANKVSTDAQKEMAARTASDAAKPEILKPDAFPNVSPPDYNNIPIKQTYPVTNPNHPEANLPEIGGLQVRRQGEVPQVDREKALREARLEAARKEADAAKMEVLRGSNAPYQESPMPDYNNISFGSKQDATNITKQYVPGITPKQIPVKSAPALTQNIVPEKTNRISIEMNPPASKVADVAIEKSGHTEALSGLDDLITRAEKGPGPRARISPQSMDNSALTKKLEEISNALDAAPQKGANVMGQKAPLFTEDQLAAMSPMAKRQASLKMSQTGAIDPKLLQGLPNLVNSMAKAYGPEVEKAVSDPEALGRALEDMRTKIAETAGDKKSLSGQVGKHLMDKGMGALLGGGAGYRSGGAYGAMAGAVAGSAGSLAVAKLLSSPGGIKLLYSVGKTMAAKPSLGSNTLGQLMRTGNYQPETKK